MTKTQQHQPEAKKRGVESFMLLPPAPGVCQVCAVPHPPDLPHNAKSLFYQMSFYRQHGRWPTWHDALKHCTSAVKDQWLAILRERGAPL